MRAARVHHALGGAAAAWPLAARAQQRERCRRSAFSWACRRRPGFSGPRRGVPAGLQRTGLDRGPQRRDRISLGRGPTPTEFAGMAAELVRAQRRRDRCHRRRSVAALLQATPQRCRSCSPVVVDPVGAGFVAQSGAAGRQRHRLHDFEYEHGGKRLELLKEIVPSVTRVAVLRIRPIAAGTAQFAAIQAVAPSLRVEVNPVNVRNAGEIERAVRGFRARGRWRL